MTAKTRNNDGRPEMGATKILEIGFDEELGSSNGRHALLCPVCGGDCPYFEEAKIRVDDDSNLPDGGEAIALPGGCPNGCFFTVFLGSHNGNTLMWAEKREPRNMGRRPRNDAESGIQEKPLSGFKPTADLAFVFDCQQRYPKTPYLLCQKWKKGKRFAWVRLPVIGGYESSLREYFDDHEKA
jgi:hypothetical protein